MHRRLAFFKRHAVPFMSRLHTFVPICAGSATISVDLKQFVAHSNVSSVGCKYFGVPTAPGINLKRQDITCNSLSLGTRSHHVTPPVWRQERNHRRQLGLGFRRTCAWLWTSVRPISKGVYTPSASDFRRL